MALVEKEAEGIVLLGFVWFAVPHNPQQVALCAEPHLQATAFRVQPWWSYTSLPDINGTACLLLADHQENGVVILSEEPVPPALPTNWTCQPADLPDDWRHDDREWTVELEAPLGSVPFSRKDASGQLLFEGDEVQLVRIHAHKTGANIYLWLCCEGWGRFGPVQYLRLENDIFVDDEGSVIAVNRGDCWHTPGRFAACCWHSPVITSSDKHPHPHHG